MHGERFSEEGKISRPLVRAGRSSARTSRRATLVNRGGQRSLSYQPLRILSETSSSSARERLGDAGAVDKKVAPRRRVGNLLSNKTRKKSKANKTRLSERKREAKRRKAISVRRRMHACMQT